MARRLFAVFLALASTVCAQRRVDPRNTYHRVICVVPIIGRGTPSDPKRPQYAPWPPATGKSQMDIVGFSHSLATTANLAIVEFAARDCAARQSSRPLAQSVREWRSQKARHRDRDEEAHEGFQLR